MTSSVDYLKMEAGRELDALIAEKVMGWRLIENQGAAGGRLWQGHGGGFGDMPEHELTPFSKEIYAAFQVVEKMRQHPDVRYQNLQLVAYCYNRTYATFDTQAFNDYDAGTWAEANGEYATPLAICRAALLATESLKEKR